MKLQEEIKVDQNCQSRKMLLKLPFSVKFGRQPLFIGNGEDRSMSQVAGRVLSFVDYLA